MPRVPRRTKFAVSGLCLLAILAAAFLATIVTSGTKKVRRVITTATFNTSIPADWHVSPLTYWAFGDGYTPMVSMEFYSDYTSCMAARGWAGSPLPVVVDLSQPSTLGGRRDFASIHGYGADLIAANDKATVAAKIDTNNFADALPPNMRQKYRWDIDGGDSDSAPPSPQTTQGCEPQALLAVNKGLPNIDPAALHAYGLAAKEVQGEPAMTAATAAWSQCMAGNGYPGLPNPATAEGKGSTINAQATATGVVPHSAIAMATTDYACQSTTLIDVRHAAEMAAVGRLEAMFPQYSSRPIE